MPKYERENARWRREQAEAAQRMVSSNPSKDTDWVSSITDALVRIRYLCAQRKLDFDALVSLSGRHEEDERKPDDIQEGRLQERIWKRKVARK